MFDAKGRNNTTQLSENGRTPAPTGGVGAEAFATVHADFAAAEASCDDAQPITIACVSYLNTLPLIAGLEKLPQVRLLPMVPSKIAGCVARGEAELGLCSLVDCERHGLVRLPVGMIACDGPTLTVRVLSKVPLQEIHTLHADVDSHTSVVLAQLLLRELQTQQGRVPTPLRIEPWKDDTARDVNLSGDSPQALLMIGDKVVLRAPSAAEYPYTLDLGEAWKKATGLPFVYAMWATTPERAAMLRTQLASQLLERQRRHNALRMGWIVQTHAPRLGWPRDTAQHYLCELLRFEPSTRSEQGAALFLSRAKAAGLL